MKTSSSYGRVVSGHSQTETHVRSDGQGNVSSSTSHSNRLRVKWANGSESYGTWKIDADHGDAVIAVFSDGNCIGEYNVTLEQLRFHKAQANPALVLMSTILCLAIIGFPLLFYFGFIQPAMVSDRRKAATLAEVEARRTTPEFKAWFEDTPQRPSVVLSQ